MFKIYYKKITKKNYFKKKRYLQKKKRQATKFGRVKNGGFTYFHQSSNLDSLPFNPDPLRTHPFNFILFFLFTDPPWPLRDSPPLLVGQNPNPRPQPRPLSSPFLSPFSLSSLAAKTEDGAVAACRLLPHCWKVWGQVIREVLGRLSRCRGRSVEEDCRRAPQQVSRWRHDPDDVVEIDSGRVELPTYAPFGGWEQPVSRTSQISFGSFGKGKHNDGDRKKGNPWTEEEHR